MRKREFKTFRDELLDVWSLDLVGVGEFDDFENLDQYS